MSRGFNTTDGVASTDIIATSLTGMFTTRSVAFWAYLTGAGGGGNGRIFDSGGGTADNFQYADTGPTLLFFRSWSGSLAQWSWPAPATGAWHQFLLVYDGGATANDPTLYMDGAAISITRQVAPSGTITNGAVAYKLGNRGDGLRCLNGRLFGYAVWNVLLTSSDAVSLMTMMPDALSANQGYTLIDYIPLDGSTTNDHVLADPTVTGTAVQADPIIMRDEFAPFPIPGMLVQPDRSVVSVW